MKENQRENYLLMYHFLLIGKKVIIWTVPNVLGSQILWIKMEER